jgi:hypothetical protein
MMIHLSPNSCVVRSRTTPDRLAPLPRRRRAIRSISLAAATALVGCVLATLAGCGDSAEWKDMKFQRDEHGLWQVKSISVEQRVVQTVASSKPDERREAVNWLSTGPRSSSDAITKLLGAILRGDPDPTVRAAAARALGTTINANAIDPLVAACSDPNEFVRLDAVRSLSGKTGDNAKRALIVRLTNDSDPQVRAAAAASLSSYRDRRVLDALIESLRDADFAIGYNAEQSLIRMTGQSFEYDADAWARWLGTIPADGNPFARAGQTPARLQQAQRSGMDRMRDAMHKAWFWWQADDKPAGK